MNIVYVLARRLHVHPAVVMLAAYHYNEIRRNPKHLKRKWRHFVSIDCFPRFVEDFALDVLAKRVKLKLTKQLEELKAKDWLNDKKTEPPKV